MRNRVMEPLWSMHSKGQQVYDRVLFINDVFFCAEDAVEVGQAGKKRAD
jgi:hypothetical protein